MAPRSFLAVPLPAAANLATAPRGVAFEAWPPVFEYTSVSSTRMLTLRPDDRTWSSAAEADVVGPAVAADDPDALADEVAGEREQVSGVGARSAPSTRASGSRSRSTRSRWRADLGLGLLRGVEEPVDEVRRRRSGARRREQRGAPGRSGRRARGASRARTRRCPRTASCSTPGRGPAAFDRPRRGRQVGAVDRRAAGRVGHDHPVAEELADEPDVGRLAAAAAGARELEERLEDLRALDRVVRRCRSRSSGGIDWKKSQRRRSTSRCSATGSMLMALWLDLGLALGRADVDAHAAAGAVVGRDLDREPVVGQVPRAELLVEEVGRRARPRPRRGRPSSGSSACGQTIAHLPQSMQIVGSQIGISWAIARFSYFAVPVGNVPSTGSALTGSRSPSPAISRDGDPRDEVGGVVGDRRRHRLRVRGHAGGDVDEALQRAVDGGEVALRRPPRRAWRRSSRRSP